MQRRFLSPEKTDTSLPGPHHFLLMHPQFFMTMMLVLYEAIIAIQVALAEAKGRSGR